MPIQSTKQGELEAFMQLLEGEARRQAQLNRYSPLPASVHQISAYVARHVWQVSLLLAVVTALFVEVFSI